MSFAARFSPWLALTAILTLAWFVEARAQTPVALPLPVPAESAKAAASADPKSVATEESTVVIDLTHRYRFIETYTKVEEKAGPALIGQYQVGIMEVLKDSVETASGKPKESEITRQTIFTERPAEVSSLGVVGATIRNYVRFQVRPDDVVRTPGPRPLDGLTLFYRTRAGESPEILSLSEDRRLREREYEVAARQVFLPSLPAVFPAYPARVGDSWRVTKRAVQALLGEGAIRGDNLVAKFAELRRETKTKRMIAVMTITGRIANPYADTLINARLEFTFDPPAPPKPALPGSLVAAPSSTTSLKPGDESIIEAHGAITELRFARVAKGMLPDAASNRLTYSASQELILSRKLGVEASGGKLLKLFDAPPSTDVNSWVTYTDPSQRFFFHHPQDLVPPERFQLTAIGGEDSIVLVKNRGDGKEMIRIDVFRKSQEPDALQDVLNAEWKRIRAEVLPGPKEWLPAADWPQPMKVYRIEAALKLGAKGTRMHYDAYLVKVSESVSLMVISTTSRDSVEGFRKDVEKLLKTFRLGPAGAL